MPRLNGFDRKASRLTRRTKPGSPLSFFDHINLLGRYAESVGRGEHRPLRNPGDPLEEAALVNGSVVLATEALEEKVISDHIIRVAPRQDVTSLLGRLW